MNIKPPMWASSPSQVSPEWRWFWESLEIGTVFWDNYTVFGKRANLATTQTGAGVIGRRLTSFGDAIDFSGGVSAFLHDIVDVTDFAKNPHTHIVTFLSDNDLDTVIMGMSTSTVNPTSFIRLNADDVADQHEFFLRGEDAIAYRSRISSLDLGDGKVHVAVGRFDGSSIELKIDNYYETSKVNPTVDLSSTTLNTSYWTTGYLQRGGPGEDPFGPFRQANRLFLPDLPRSFGSVVVPSDTQRQPITVTDGNIITNPDFTTDSDWTKDGGWTIENGLAVSNGSETQALEQSPSSMVRAPVEGRQYKLEVVVVNYVSGQCGVRVASGGDLLQLTGNGTFTSNVIAGGVGGYNPSIGIQFNPNSSFDGDIESIYLYESNTNISQQPELITNGGFDTDTAWDKGAGWSISAGVASASATTSNLGQAVSGGLKPGRSYLVTYTLVNYTGGTVRVDLRGNVGSTRSTNGTYVEVITVTSYLEVDDVRFVGLTAFTGDIDNVSVREVNIKITP
jgi:hypothetical protein